jgi:hypothetical protein
VSAPTRTGFYRNSIRWYTPVDAESGNRTGPRKDEPVNRMAPVRNAPLCRETFHRPWPVGRGWICLRCSHYERGGEP